MSHIDELIAELMPHGVNFEPIGQLAEVTSGATPSRSVPDYWTNGTIPWLSSGEVNKETIFEADTLITEVGYASCSTRMMPSGSVVMALAGQGKTRGMVARTRLECCTNQSLATIVPKSGLDSDFLFYYLRTQYAKLREISSGDGTRGGLNLAMIRAFRIPLPPLEVQWEVVRVLDRFSELEAELVSELEAELDSRRCQFDHYRNKVLTFGVDTDWLQLSEVADYTNGRAHEKFADPKGQAAMITARFISRNGEANRFIQISDIRTPAVVGDVAMVLSDLPNGRALARTFHVDRNNAYAINQRVARIRVTDPSRTSSRFLYHYLNRNPDLLAFNNGADQTHLSKAQVTGLKFPAIAFSEQQRIAQVLDEFAALASQLVSQLSAEITSRRSQFGYYRDKLLTFKDIAA